MSSLPVVEPGVEPVAGPGVRPPVTPGATPGVFPARPVAAPTTEPLAAGWPAPPRLARQVRRHDPRLVPRPGPVWGPYPMREAPELPARLWQAWLMQRLQAPPAPSRRDLPRLVAAVRQRVRTLDALGPAQAAEVLRGVRLQLGRDGFRPVLCVQALAHVVWVVQQQLGLALYDTQIVAGWTMLGNRLIEMATGEGKTLTALLTAATAALAGVPVHVLTSNDYLAARDADSLRPIYQALGLSVSCVQAADDEAARRRAYAADVTYATAREVAFDHLRDRLGATQDGHAVPAARPAGAPVAAPAAGHARPVLRGLCMAVLDEADNVLIDEAITPMILSQQVPAAEEGRRLRLALYLARQLTVGDDAREALPGHWELTAAGRAWLDARAASLGAEWQVRRFREEQVGLALAALHSFRRDVDYVVHDGEIQIVDTHTGRRAQGRAWSRGLHQLVGLKEGLQPAPSTRTMMQMTYQQFFPRYLRLCGLSGTLAEARRELMAVYGLPVVPIPTARRSRRRNLGTRVLPEADDKWAVVVARARALQVAGRPVLIGTGSVAESERVSVLLGQAGVAHRVLNASQDAEEAEIVEQAGDRGAVTVATQMAGRGTDIPVGDDEEARGGLHVINASLYPARRIDRQLDGRCARRGQQGSHERVLSLDEPLFARELPAGLLRLLAGCPDRLRRLAATWVQTALEARAERTRWALMRQEEALARGLAWTGRHPWD